MESRWQLEVLVICAEGLVSDNANVNAHFTLQINEVATGVRILESKSLAKPSKFPRWNKVRSFTLDLFNDCL